MCGIAGLVDPGGLGPHGAELLAASRAGAHRGPDGQGLALFDVARGTATFVAHDERLPPAGALADATLGLSHRRLAIIDLTPSALQPMANEDGSVWITYNGEIYNFLELRGELEARGHRFRSRSDTEVILHAWETWGEACVDRFIGMWAFALVDLRARRLFASRDRFGIKPFHYYVRGRSVAFASEIKQLLCWSFVPRRARERVVHAYLAREAVDWGEETFFEDVRRLLPGHHLTVDLATGQIATIRYYALPAHPVRPVARDTAAADFRALLTDSVRLQLRSDVRVGSCLSGGLDSSAIVILMHDVLGQERKRDVQYTFSAHFEDPEANELEYMLQVVERTGVKAAFTYPDGTGLLEDLDRLVWHQDEPFASTSLYAQWSVFRLVRERGVKVVLDGQGADEILAGYVSLAPHYFAELASRRRYRTLLWETWRHARLQGLSWSRLVAGLAAGVLGRLRGDGRGGAPSAPDWIRPEFATRHAGELAPPAGPDVPFATQDHLARALFRFTFVTNLPALLRYEDRNAMAFSVESRVPFLDHRLVELAFALPSNFKIRDGYSKRILRDALGGVLPETIRWRARKLGFATPERRWQRTALRPLIAAALADERLAPYIVPERAAAAWRAIEASDGLSFLPWRWLNLSRWLQRYEIR